MELDRPVQPSSCSVSDARQRVREGAVLLDVREPHEWEAGHAEGAQHIPLGSLDAHAGQLDPALSYVVICRSGSRSARACALLADRGFRAANVAGGMLEWEEAGYPVVTDAGTPGRVA